MQQKRHYSHIDHMSATVQRTNQLHQLAERHRYKRRLWRKLNTALANVEASVTSKLYLIKHISPVTPKFLQTQIRFL